MEIIVPGDILRLTKKFYCGACGCIFKADWHEYKTYDDKKDISYCECPTCDCLALEISIDSDNFCSAVSVLLAEKLKDFEKRG